MATLQGESTIGYHGLETQTPDAAKSAQIEQVQIIIKKFLDDIQFDRSTPFIKNRDLEVAVWDYFSNLFMGQDIERKVQKRLKISVTSIHQAYTSLPFDIKVASSAHVLYMFLVDDIAEEFIEDLQIFNQK